MKFQVLDCFSDSQNKKKILLHSYVNGLLDVKK